MWSQAAARSVVVAKCGHTSRPGRFMLLGVRYGKASMTSVGIREAKARLSGLARDAAKGTRVDD
jgi:hypothetical protein